MTSSKLWPVSTCMTGNGRRAGQNAFGGQVQHHDRVLAAGEQQHRALELGRHLTEDVDGSRPRGRGGARVRRSWPSGADRLKVDLSGRQSDGPPRSPRPARDADHLLAHELATRAGELLLELRAAGRRVGRTSAGRSATTATSAATTSSSTRCATARPDDRVLSEEGVEDRRRLGAPAGLDRRPARRHPRVRRARPVRLGRARRPRDRRQPRRRRRRAAGAWASTLLHGGRRRSRPPTPTARRPAFVVSRSRPHPATILAAEVLGADLVPDGLGRAPRRWRSCAGEVDVYAHAGGQYEWDSAAPAAVALAAGLHVSGVDGSRARVEQARPVAAPPAHLPPRARRPGHRGRPRSSRR